MTKFLKIMEVSSRAIPAGPGERGDLQPFRGRLPRRPSAESILNDSEGLRTPRRNDTVFEERLILNRNALHRQVFECSGGWAYSKAINAIQIRD